MTREEREEYVVQLYKEGKGVRNIGAITNKVKLQADRERGYTVEEPQPKSDESRAFKMFSEDKSPVNEHQKSMNLDRLERGFL